LETALIQVGIIIGQKSCADIEGKFPQEDFSTGIQRDPPEEPGSPGTTQRISFFWIKSKLIPLSHFCPGHLKKAEEVQVNKARFRWSWIGWRVTPDQGPYLLIQSEALGACKGSSGRLKGAEETAFLPLSSRWFGFYN
jgi:hypothetical protein